MNGDGQRRVLSLIRTASCNYTKQQILLEECKGRSVLDVGCVGQARIEGKHWLHKSLASVASSITGVDIVRDGISRGRAKGYDIVHVDDLREDQLYERIVMGDVIEHVNDPVSFLAKYGKHLVPGGCVVLTTPNVFSATHFITTALRGAAYVNEEHTLWLEPMTIAEIAHRANLELLGVEWLWERSKSHSVPEFVVRRVARAMTKAQPALADLLFCRLGKAHQVVEPT